VMRKEEKPKAQLVSTMLHRQQSLEDQASAGMHEQDRVKPKPIMRKHKKPDVQPAAAHTGWMRQLFQFTDVGKRGDSTHEQNVENTKDDKITVEVNDLGDITNEHGENEAEGTAVHQRIMGVVPAILQEESSEIFSHVDDSEDSDEKDEEGTSEQTEEQKHEAREHAKYIFGKFDSNNDGFLEKHEVAQLLQDNSNEWRAYDIEGAEDEKPDGMLSLKEFLQTLEVSEDEKDEDSEDMGDEDVIKEISSLVGTEHHTLDDNDREKHQNNFDDESTHKDTHEEKLDRL